MKRFLWGLVLALALGTMAFATTTDALMISASGLIATVSDNGVCVGSGCVGLSNDINPSAGTDTVTGTIDGWTLNIVSGTSHSPTLIPFGLDVTSLTATCTGGPCTTNPLDIKFSDINFNVPTGGFMTTYSATITGTGTTSESAYVDNTNTLFGEPGAGLIGTVGPLKNPAPLSGSASGGPAGVPNYSLTLDQVFTDVSGTPVSFSVDGNVTAVPEPASVALFGTVLVFCASRLRRRKV